jgi:hypothetical protein
VADPPEPSLSLNADISRRRLFSRFRPANASPQNRSLPGRFGCKVGLGQYKGQKSLERDTNRQNSTNKPQEPNRFTDIERKCRKVKPNKPSNQTCRDIHYM